MTYFIRLIFFCLVPEVGLEPTLCFHKRILSPSRLPIPPFGHIGGTTRI